MNQFIQAFHTTYATDAYRYLGAHTEDLERPYDVTFRVYAPHAQAISVVGDFNGWNLRLHPMKLVTQGIWELMIPNLPPFSNYKYAITHNNRTFLKQDPYAYHFETNGKTSSKVYPLGPYPYSNEATREDVLNCPMNIYEVHVSSWKRHENGHYYSYRDLARELIPYAKEMGYTHLELMPIMEYPFDGSWGYQVTGYYGITSRFGTPDDFRYFVHKAHQAGLGVILDWVPAHFAKDEFGLIEYDGEVLYEDPEPTKMEHVGWGTRIFHFASPEVKSFLISNALFYFEAYHIDGLRVDAVASMLYLDYDRKLWKPNRAGNNLNLEAITFLKELNEEVRRRFPRALMIAEESTSFAGITKPVAEGGLGFHLKWNMGWMNDTLKYMMTDPLFRSGEHQKLTFSLVYAFNEHFVLPLSHDEVVHGKKSLVNKMPGEYEEKFSELKLLYGYMMTHPGKKLSFMGNEFAQYIEWNYNQGLDWLLMLYPKHAQHHHFIKTLNHLYLKNTALWENDENWDGFAWIQSKQNDNLIAYTRTSKSKKLLIILNFSGLDYHDYRFGIERGSYEVILNSDEVVYGGDGLINPTPAFEPIPCDGKRTSLRLNIPRQSVLILKMK